MAEPEGNKTKTVDYSVSKQTSPGPGSRHPMLLSLKKDLVIIFYCILGSGCVLDRVTRYPADFVPCRAFFRRRDLPYRETAMKHSYG